MSAPTTANPPCDFYVVLDFEAAFDKPEGHDKTMEVIELPSVIVDARTGAIRGEFQRYARPRIFPKMHPMVTEITGITQATVDAAQPFPHVMAEYLRWLDASHLSALSPSAAVHSKNIVHPAARSFMFVTCGDWDIKTMFPVQFKNDGGIDAMLSQAKIQPDQVKGRAELVRAMTAQWCNLKDAFNAWYPDARVKGMTDMLRYLRLPLVGRHHSGIDDCRNIAAVLCAMLAQKCVIDATNTRAAVDQRTPNGQRYKHIEQCTTHLLPGRLPSFHGDLALAFAASSLTDREPLRTDDKQTTASAKTAQATTSAPSEEQQDDAAIPTKDGPTQAAASPKVGPVGATPAEPEKKRKNKGRLQ
jgi:ERI1 exoribonuclease 3